MAKQPRENPKHMTKIGGQALIEGVMMKGADTGAMACRLPNGEIEVETWPENNGKPCYDSMMAEKVSALEIPCFACPPERLPELLEAAMKHQSLQNFSR